MKLSSLVRVAIDGRSKIITNRNPTSNDDSSAGIARFATWINSNTNILFDCKDNTAGAAVWEERISPSRFAELGLVTSNTTLAGGGNTINNIVFTSNAIYDSITTKNANTTYFTA